MDPHLAFHDFLPFMAQRLGGHGLMQELAIGFRLLTDPASQTITLPSLKRNAARLGLPPMSDCELRDMIRLGDTGGRGELDLHQFCVAMIRTSPTLMEQALEIILKDGFSQNADGDMEGEEEGASCDQSPLPHY